jgi:hypothetical protein
MEKITLKALQLAGFQNAEMIARIISYVPNPQVATEMLLGVYEPKELDQSERFRKYKYDDNKIIEITGIDELGNIVTYKEYKQRTQTVYYLTSDDQKNKIYQLERPKGDYYNNGSIPANGFSEHDDNTTVSIFEDKFSTKITNEDAFKLLEEWENYGVVIEKDPTDLEHFAMQA